MDRRVLHAIVVDVSRPITERSRALRELGGAGARFPEIAWRVAMREPLRAKLDELGLLAPTFDEDFDEVAPLVDLELDKVVAWALRALRLRCVPVVSDLQACSGERFRAALARVTETEPTIEVIGSPRAPSQVRIGLGKVSGVVGPRQPASAVFTLLGTWAARERGLLAWAARKPQRHAVYVSNLAMWIATDRQLEAARELGLQCELTITPPPRVSAIVPDARTAPIDTDPDDEIGDFQHLRSMFVETACAISDRLAVTKISGLHVTLEVDGQPVNVKLPRPRNHDDLELERGIVDALNAAVGSRLGMQFVLVTGRLVALVTSTELDRLRDAGLLL